MTGSRYFRVVMTASAFLPTAALLASSAPAVLAESRFTDWSAPVNLGCGGINTSAKDAGPGITKDGLSLYFASDRLHAGDMDIYVSHRSSVDAPWGAPQHLDAVSATGFADNAVNISRDGHWMFFNSNRPGGFGDIDIWASYRSRVHDDFGWQEPVNLGPGVNTAAFEAGPSYFENGEGGTPLLFFGRGTSGSTMRTTTDIMVAEQLPDGTFGNPQPVAELNSASGDLRPSIRFDGLEIFFYSYRLDPKNLLSDLFVATRKTLNDPWDAPTPVNGVNSATEAEFNPQISGDGTELYWARTNGACGDYDMYVSTRSRARGPA